MLLNSQSKAFEENLNTLINNCGLTVSEAYYIVQNAALNLKNLYLDLIYQEQFQGDKTMEENIEIDVPAPETQDND